MRTIALALALVALAVAPSAAAWTDARPAGLVTELAVDRDGGATVTLRMRWRVLAGRFRTFEIAELPSDAALLEATGTDATGNAVAVATRAPATGRLEVTLGEEGGLRRGAIDVVLRYTTSLRAQGAIRRVGPDAVLEVVTVPWERGLEATELRVALPASVGRAQWLADETPGIDATVTSELGRDVVHAMRRHVPAGTRWTARIACDPALFTWLDGPQAAHRAQRAVPRRSVLPTLALGASLALALGAAAALARRRSPAGAYVPLPGALAAVPVPLAAAGGAVQALVMQNASGAATVGTLLAIAGLALVLPRLAPLPGTPAAQPMRLWPEARARALRSAPSRRRRIAVAFAWVLVAAPLAWHAVAHGSVPAAVLAIDLVLLGGFALAATRALHPASDVAALTGLHKTLARYTARLAMARPAWRVRGDGRAPGSVRVRVVARPGFRYARGVRAIECAVAWRAGALRWRATPVLIVRAECGAPLERALRQLATQAGAVQVDPERGEIAWVVDLLGPDRATALAELHALLPAALVRVPAAGAHAARIHAGLADHGTAL